ncbi:MAG: tetratricopeptide repeat protein [Proteobacteria bacterium]|nr:tetratricopeptide repeat protein [Pseudomonadota bacterium]
MNIHLLKIAAVCLILIATPSFASSLQDSKVVGQYRKALELNPSDYGLRYSLGLSLLQDGRYDEAVAELNLLYPQRKEAPDINFNLGYAYLQLKNNDKAYEMFSKVESLGSDFGKKYHLETAFLGLAISYRQEGLNEKAITSLNKALSIDPNNVKIHLFLADIYLKLGNNEKALDYLEDAMTIDEDNEDIVSMISNTHNRVGLTYLANKQYLEARQEFSNALEIDSSSLYAIYYLGYLEYLEKNTEAAAYHLEKLTSLKIEDENLKKGLKPLLFNIGLYYIQSNQPQKGLRLMDKLLALFPEYSKALYYSAVASMETGAYAEAIEKLELYLKDSPDDSKASSRLAQTYEKAVQESLEKGQLAYYRKDFRIALLELDKVLAVSESHEKALKLRQLAAAELEKIEGEEREQVLKLISLTLAEVGTLIKEEEFGAARDKLIEAEKIAPFSREVKNTLEMVSARIAKEISKNLKNADMSIGRKDYFVAMQHYRSVIALETDNSKAKLGLDAAGKELDSLITPLLNKAGLLMKKESFLASYEIYEKVLKIDPANEDAMSGRELSRTKIDSLFKEYLSMARDYASVDQHSLASSYYKRALKLRPGDEAALRESAQLDRKMGRVSSVVILLKKSNNALNKGKLNNAIAGFSDVLKLEPGNSAAKSGLKKAKSQRLKKLSNMIAEADLFFEEARYAEVIGLGKKIIALDKRNTKAQNLLHRASTAVDSKVTPYLKKGKSSFDSGNMDEAIVLFQKALKADPGNQLAKRYLSKVDYKKKQATIAKAIKKNYLNGLDAYTKGRYKLAMDEWVKVLELEPAHEKAKLNIGKAKRKIAAMGGG